MKLDDLLAEITMHASWLTPGAARRVLLRAAEALCQRSWVWQERLDAEVVSAASMPAEPWAPCDASVVAVREVFTEGRRLHPVVRSVLDGIVQDPRALIGAPQAFYCPEPKQVYVVPAPAENITISIHAVLAPKITATTLPDVLDKYSDALIAGALTRAMLHPGAGEKGPAMSSVWAGRFERGVSEAKRDAMMGHQSGNAHIEANPLA